MRVKSRMCRSSHNPTDDAGPELDLFRDYDHLGVRAAVGFIALPFGLIACWMHYIVSTFLTDDDWLSVAVSIILYELIYAVGALTATMLIWALFAPSWIPWLFDKALGHVFLALIAFALLLVVPFIVVILASFWI